MCWLGSTTWNGNPLNTQLLLKQHPFLVVIYLFFLQTWTTSLECLWLRGPTILFCDHLKRKKEEVKTWSLSRGYFYTALVKPYSTCHRIFCLFFVVVVVKIDRARGKSLYVRLDSCRRYYRGIRGILCLIESAYKGIGILKGKKKKQHVNFLRVLLVNDRFSGLIFFFLFFFFLFFSEALRVSMWTLTLFLIPNKAWQQCAAGCQNSPGQRSFILLLKTRRHMTLCGRLPKYHLLYYSNSLIDSYMCTCTIICTVHSVFISSCMLTVLNHLYSQLHNILLMLVIGTLRSHHITLAVLV